MKRRTNQRGDETRTRVLVAAREQFAQQGYDGASLRMIAASAGLNLALLHYHFGSKADLYRAVWADQYSQEEERTRRKVYTMAPAEEPPQQALRHIIEAALVGPIHLLNDKLGAEFITILARELADPKAMERGLIEEFINPICEDTQTGLRRVMPELSEEDFSLGLLLTIAASQQLVHYWTLSLMRLKVPAPVRLEPMMATMIDFLVAGWERLGAKGA